MERNLRYGQREVNLISAFIRPAVQTQQISENACKDMLETLRLSLNKPKAEPSKEKVLTISETCRELKLSKPSIYSLIRQGKLKVIRFGRAPRILDSSINKLISE